MLYAKVVNPDWSNTLRSGVPVCLVNYENLPYVFLESRYQKSLV